MPNKLCVWECVNCGRLWVGERTVNGHVVMEHLDCDHVNCQTTHTGPCVPGDPPTWTARCDGPVAQVKPWPALRAAFKIGGREGAQGCVRHRDERGRQPIYPTTKTHAPAMRSVREMMADMTGDPAPLTNRPSVHPHRNRRPH